MIVANRRTLLDGGALRLPGDPAEEVRIGAYARRQFRRRIWFGLFGVALILGAAGLYANLRPGNAWSRSEVYEAPVRCVGCGFEGSMTIPIGGESALACPTCGSAKCRAVWLCRACGERFVPVKASPPVRCAKCGSSNVGSAAPAAGSR